MKSAKTKPPAEVKQDKPDASLVNYTDWIARATMHPGTPAVVKHALQSIIVSIVSNESGYSWDDDEEGLRFLLPRYLFHMHDQYALAILPGVGELIDSAIPRDVRDKIGSPFGSLGERGGDA